MVYVFIMTVTIEIIRDGAFSLISDMENLGLIRVNCPARIDNVSGKKLSEQFAGALKIPNELYEVYQNSLQESRNEWTRATY